MASNYVDLYHNVDNDTMTEQEGLELHGRDGVFCTSPLYTDIPLLTESQSVAEAINELFGQGTGANGAFRAVFDDNAGVLTIVVQEHNKYADYQFGYEVFDFSDKITTHTVVGEETVKTTRNFSKRIVTSLLGASGAVLLVTDYNADSGVILGYTDGSGEVVHTAEWRSEYESVVSQSPGAASAAIAWVIARNMEQSTSLSKEKQAYKDGLKVGIAGGANITEEYEQESTKMDLTIDENGRFTSPYIGSFTDGIYVHSSDGRYVHLWLDMSVEEVTQSATATDTKRGKLVYDAYNADGTLIDSQAVTSKSNYWWQNATEYSTGTILSYQVKWMTINFSGGASIWTRWLGNQGDTMSSYWDSPIGETYMILAYAVRITNIPPEIIN